MRRLFAVTIVIVGLITGVAAPASAAGPTKQTSGPVSGTEIFFEFNANGCFLFEQLDLALANGGTLSLDGCVNAVGRTDFTFDGTFDLRARNGATLTGTFTGTVLGFPDALSVTLQVQSGTKQFMRLRGTLTLTSQDFSPSSLGSRLTGQLTSTLTR